MVSHKRNFKETGFTLLEVIIVSAIISIGLLAIVKIFPLGFQAEQKAEQSSIAAVLAQETMEKIKRGGYDKLSVTYPSDTKGYGRGEGECKGHEGYRWQVDWWDTEIPHLRKIRVRILYRKPGKDEEISSEQNLDLFTYLAKRD
ncbi:MAG: prepilin-type N-terminal cleavage/methylation domain-containing protein [Candidatus Aerophobetes bacterium]|nr:prepilin-type N-terminal cleavage/methylation domain-containing protein [Candidatus Aerophobetes bacterium]